MKIIDILNKMANKELEDGFKFKYDNDTYCYDKEDNEITSVRGLAYLGDYYRVETIINNEVEVIEENKDIKELEILDSDRKVMATFTLNNREKINELVRAVNKLNKEREEK